MAFLVRPALSLALLAAFLICLLAASISDLRCGEVADGIWWIALAAGLSALLPRIASSAPVPYTLADHIGLSLVFLMQEVWMARAYGRADAHAFCACALMQAGLGLPLTAQAVQMTVSLLLLTVVQAARRNIRRDGRLKRPVPFLPYITAGFAVSLLALHFPVR